MGKLVLFMLLFVVICCDCLFIDIGYSFVYITRDMDCPFFYYTEYIYKQQLHSKQK